MCACLFCRLHATLWLIHWSLTTSQQTKEPLLYLSIMSEYTLVSVHMCLATVNLLWIVLLCVIASNLLVHCCDDIGGAIGFFCGLLNTTLNWRWTFRILGIAGLCVVPLSIFILYEPRVIRENRKQRRRGRTSYSILVSLTPICFVHMWGYVDL